MFPDLLGSNCITTTTLGIIMRNDDKSIEVINEATALYKQWLTEREAAEYLNVSPSFLAKQRAYGKKSEIIPYVRLSKKCIRYDFNQLQCWLNAQIEAFKDEVTA
jgi:hypothetical protein